MSNLETHLSTSPYPLTPELRAMVMSGDDFADFPTKGPPLSGVVQLASKDCDPESPKFVAGAASGLIVLRFGVDDAKAVKDFIFTPFGADQRFSVYEPSHGTEQGAYVETLSQKPTEARWRADANGRQRCLLPDGCEIRETKVVYMIVSGRRIIAFAAHSSGLKPINAMIDRAGRLSVKHPFEIDGKVEIKNLNGPLVSKWSMATLEQRQGAYRWWIPHPTFLGKLGEKNGPTIEDTLFAKQVRENFRQGGPLWEPSAPIAASGRTQLSPLPDVDHRRLTAVTSGPPPIAENDVNLSRAIDDDIPF